MYEICPELPEDTPEVEALYDLCFAPGRTALSSYRLRDGVPRVARLCLVLRDPSGVLMAAIRYWPARVAGRRVLLLGPVAVHPTAQGEGLGGLLMRDSLARARSMGFARVLLVGDAPYYSRFGFQRLDGVTRAALTRAFGAASRSRRVVRDRGDLFNRLASTVSGAAGRFPATAA